MKTFFAIILSSLALEMYGQADSNGPRKEKFFISAGYGLAGSFFVRSYDEFAPVARSAVFYKKRFVGISQNIGFGVNLTRGFQLKTSINYQHFTRKINFEDILGGSVFVKLNHTIHHRDYIWCAGVTKALKRNKHIFLPGIGIYYIRSEQEEVEIFYPNFVSNVERNFQSSNLEEAGAYMEFLYEYEFQP